MIINKVKSNFYHVFILSTGVVSTVVQDSPHKIFIGGLPNYLNEDQVSLAQKMSKVWCPHNASLFLIFITASVISLNSLSDKEVPTTCGQPSPTQLETACWHTVFFTAQVSAHEDQQRLVESGGSSGLALIPTGLGNGGSSKQS